MNEKVRLGGMALGNGVLVHGPQAWAAAVRTRGGEVKVVASRKSVQASTVRSPLLRGPARIAEALSLVPLVKLRVPEAELPMARPRVIGSMIAGSVLVRAVRRSGLNPVVRELAAAGISIAPALLALRGGELASYHGAEHIAIGTYEHGEDRPREHERCGSHLVGPMLVTTAAANIIADRAPEEARPAARAAGTFGAVAASVELFGWMNRHPQHPLARALAWPGHELQHRLGTRDPSPEQLEVANAALRACLELET